jgi:hypothetical protein
VGEVCNKIKIQHEYANKKYCWNDIVWTVVVTPGYRDNRVKICLEKKKISDILFFGENV